MNLIANILVGLVAVLHFGFLTLEMFFWDHPVGRNTFKMTPEYSKASASLAANQGIDDGFLAAGLLWGLVTSNTPVQIFFLIFVVGAGNYDVITANRSSRCMQTLPGF